MKEVMTLCLAVVALGLTVSTAMGENFVVGESLYLQNGWHGGDWDGDEWNKIKDGEMVTDTVSHTGSNSWYFPGGPTTQGAGTPFSPRLNKSVGAPSYADTATMDTTLWFKAADPTGDGSGFSLYQGSIYGDDRTGFNVYVDATEGGIDIGTYRWADNTFVWENIASGLALDAWHSIDIESLFKDDFLNDEITYTIDKGTSSEVVSSVGNTWTHPWFDENRNDYFPGDGLKFAWSSAAPDAALGFYFDDISYSIGSGESYSTSFESETDGVPEPATLTLLGLSSAALLRRRRGTPARTS
ncbi:MAG: PEP-CTERM sorting domain-containing protein [Candidatus Pacebacteria bacterium]|nr:PEP-CTERM sorting domain-containing protein [Candidatus Paceibacterota bacterium]